jgi:hypothetical protein
MFEGSCAYGNEHSGPVEVCETLSRRGPGSFTNTSQFHEVCKLPI